MNDDHACPPRAGINRQATHMAGRRGTDRTPRSDIARPWLAMLRPEHVCRSQSGRQEPDRSRCPTGGSAGRSIRQFFAAASFMAGETMVSRGTILAGGIASDRFIAA